MREDESKATTELDVLLPFLSALFAAAGFYAVSHLEQSAILASALLCATLYAVALSLFSLSHATARSVARATLCTAIFLFLGSLIAHHNLSSTTSLPVMNNGARINGVVLRDVQPGQSGRVVIMLKPLFTVQNGVRTERSGAPTEILLASGKRFFWGQRCTAVIRSVAPPGRNKVPRYYAESLTANGWRNSFFRWRRDVVQRISGASERLPAGPGALVPALLLGDRSLVPLRVEEAFRKSGTIHALALSGMHLAVLCGLFSAATRRFLGRNTALAVTVLVAWAYLFLAGPRPALFRASLMVTGGAFFAALDRKVGVLSLLSLTFLLSLLLGPRSAQTLSFQLSFAALAGILTVGREFAYRWPFARGRAVWTALSVSFGAQLATAPLVAAAFGVLFPAGIVATLFVAPLVTVLLSLSLIWGGVVMTIGASAAVAGGAAEHGIGMLMNIVYLLLEKTTIAFSRLPEIRLENGKGVILLTAISAVAGTAVYLPRVLALIQSGRREQNILHSHGRAA